MEDESKTAEETWQEIVHFLADRNQMWADRVIVQKAEIKQLRAALEQVSAVEKQIRLMAYTSAGDPKRMDDMRMYAIWAGSLQKALTAGGVTDAE